MSYLVLDNSFLNKPMVMLDYDGNKKVPKPGILFICTEEFPPTEFANKRAADAAIARSKKYRGEAADLPRYRVIERGAYLEATSPRVRKKKGKKRAKADG